MQLGQPGWFLQKRRRRVVRGKQRAHFSVKGTVNSAHISNVTRSRVRWQRQSARKHLFNPGPSLGGHGHGLGAAIIRRAPAVCSAPRSLCTSGCEAVERAGQCARRIERRLSASPRLPRRAARSCSSIRAPLPRARRAREIAPAPRRGPRHRTRQAWAGSRAPRECVRQWRRRAAPGR